jgi:very-short-patch-repair endonuclease
MAHSRSDPHSLSLARQLRHNLTEAETRLWQLLHLSPLCDIHFRRQHPIGPYIADFCSPRNKLIIEVDGGQHLEQEEQDTRRSKYLESKGYRVIRFWNDEVLKQPEAVFRVICEALGVE